jgi:hypothetical protein
MGDHDIPDGKYPFADQRFAFAELTLTQPPQDLADLIEAELARTGVEVPTDELLEIHLKSEDFATASFAIRRDASGTLLMLIPLFAARRPN